MPEDGKVKTGRPLLPLLAVALALGVGTSIRGAGDGAPLSAWPAPPADAAVPDADQQVEIIQPQPGQRFGNAERLHVAYQTGDGQEAELYVDGERVRNHAEIRLSRYALGIHTVRANPLMHPEKGREITFEIVPTLTLQESPETIDALLDMDPASAARLDTASLRVISINGQPQLVDVAPVDTVKIIPSELAPTLRCAKAIFSKKTLQTMVNGQAIRRLGLQGSLENPPSTFSLEAALLSPAPASSHASHSSDPSTDSALSCPGTPDKFIFERVWGRPEDLLNPIGLAVGPLSGDVFVVDSDFSRVVHFDNQGGLVRAWGHAGFFDPGDLGSPFGIAVTPDERTLYVTDPGRSRVLKFNSDGTFLREWFVGSPKGIAVDISGNLYVISGDSVLKYDATGTLVTRWGSSGSGPGQFFSPYALAVSAAGHVYVTETGNHRVQKFDFQGAFLAGWGTFGTGTGQFRSPKGIALARNDSVVLVVDSDNARIQSFDAAGAFVSQGGSPGSGTGQFSMPAGIGVDPQGNFCVADAGNDRGQKFAPDGSSLLQFGDTTTAVGFFQRPIRVNADNLGNVFVADEGNDSVQKFRSDGTRVTGWTVSVPRAVGVSADGQSVYVGDGARNIQKFDGDGNFILQWNVNRDNSLSGIAVDSQGMVYLAAGSKVEKYSPTGSLVLSWGTSGVGNGKFVTLVDIAVDRRTDTLYTLDLRFDNTIQSFSSTGTFLFNYGGIANGSRGLTVDVRDGLLFTTGSGFKKYNTNGTFVKEWFKPHFSSQTPDAFEFAYGITADSGTNLFITDRDLKRVAKFRQSFEDPPTAEAGPDKTTPIYLLTTLDGSASSDDCSGILVKWVWDFGDGSPAQEGAVVQHRYYQTGTYTATLTVTDDDGMTDSDTATLTVGSGPTAVITASSLQAGVGQPVDFSGAGSTDPTGTITDYGWTFGDGGTATGVGVTHAFRAKGAYRVALTVKDSNALTATSEVTLQVASRVPTLVDNLRLLVQALSSPTARQLLLDDLDAVSNAYQANNLQEARSALDKFFTDLRDFIAQGEVGADEAQPIQASADQVWHELATEADTVSARPLGAVSRIGLAGRLLDEPLSVQLRDAQGQPAVDLPVEFRIVEGRGTLVKDWLLDTVTDAEGKAGMRFLCPTDLSFAGGKSGLATVDAVRRVRDPETGDLREQVLATFSIQTRLPEFRFQTENAAELIYRENAGTQPYAVFVGDSRVSAGLPPGLADQDVAYRFADANGIPLDTDRGIILPAVQVTGVDGLAFAAYVSKPDSPLGVFRLQARLLPPLKDEAGRPLEVDFPLIDLRSESEDNINLHPVHDILAGNGHVMLPGENTGAEIRVHVDFQNLILTTHESNQFQVTKGTVRQQAPGSVEIEPQSADRIAGFKVVHVPAVLNRQPIFIKGRGFDVGRSEYAAGEPEVYLVEENGAVADSVLPTSLDDLSQPRKYFVEARLPIGFTGLPGGVDPPGGIGGPVAEIRGLDVGLEEEPPARPEFVAPTRLSLPLQKISENDRYALWRAGPFVPVMPLRPGQTAPALPANPLQVLAFGAVRPAVAVGGAVYPEGKLKGPAPKIGAFQLEEERFLSASSSARRLVKYVHLGVVTPLVEIDAQASGNVVNDAVTVRGKVRSTVHMLGASPGAKPVVHVEGQVAAVTDQGDGLFSFETPLAVQLDEAEQILRASAYNPYGGYGLDEMTVDASDMKAVRSKQLLDQGILPDDSCRPVLHRIVLGTDPALLDLGPLTLKLKNQAPTITLALGMLEGRVVSEPFVVTDTTFLKNQDAIPPLASRVLVTASLDEDLEVSTADGVKRAVFPLAGVRVTDPKPFSQETVGFAQDAFGRPEPVTRQITLELRNVSRRRPRVSVAFFGEDLLPGQKRPEVDVDMAGDLLNTFAKAFQTKDVLFLPGRAMIRAKVVDLDGQEILACSEASFKFAPDLLTHVQEVVPGVLTFPIKAGVTDAQISDELDKLKLRMIGRVRFQEGAGSQEKDVDDILLVQAADGNRTRVVGAIQASPLRLTADSQEAEQEIFTEPLGPNPVAQWLGYGQQWAEKEKERNRDVRDALNRATSTGAPSERLLVADMRISDAKVKGGTSPFETNPLIEPVYRHGAPNYELRVFRASGVDQRRHGEAFVAPGDEQNSNRPPRIRFEREAPLTLTTEILTSQVKGVILQIHGFNESFLDKLNEWGQIVVERPSLLSNTLPFSQYQMRRKDGTPSTVRLSEQEYVVIHAVWTGDHSAQFGVLPDAAWFNVDYALADHTGRNPLARLIADILRLKGSDPNFVLALLPQSLGNRVAASGTDAIRRDATYQDVKGILQGANPPKLRMVLIHPALRQPDLLDNVEKDPPVLPTTPLQLDFSLAQPSLMFYSTEDKPGVAFHTGQKVPMLGREGRPGGYQLLIPGFDIKQRQANDGTAFKDRWHVTLFGTVIPNMLEYSRPIHNWNGDGKLGSGLIGAMRTEYHLIRYTSQHLDEAWDAIKDYVETGARPPIFQ